MKSDGGRSQEILARLRGDGSPFDSARLCDVCAEVTGATGAGIMLMIDDAPHGSICSTDSVSATIEQLQFDLGEGPCIDACREGRMISEPDLSAPQTARWVAFTPPAVAAGARAVFGLPLQIGSVRIGALNLYCDRPGSLTDAQHADALLVAGIAAQSVLAMQGEAPEGMLAAELEAGLDLHHVVHQAAGMVAVQIGVGVGEALVRLRAHAFGNGRPLTDVARDVVGRTLRFDG